MTRRPVVVWAALALLLWSAAIWLSGGFRITILDVAIGSRDALRPLALAVLLVAGGYAFAGRRPVDDEFERAAHAFGRAAWAIAIVCALAVVVVGLRWGSYAGSGVD